MINEVFKPQEKLLEGDIYQSKPQIAGKIITELIERGFKIKLVLADSEYGESESNFVNVLKSFKLNYIVAIRSNHGVLMASGQRVRRNQGKEFKRIHSDGKKEKRYIREIIFGKRRETRYWEITTEPEKLPEDTTGYVMTNYPEISEQEVGNL